MAALKLVEIQDVTPGADYLESEDDQKALDKAPSRRSAFNFAMVKIPVGSKLEETLIKSEFPACCRQATQGCVAPKSITRG